MQDLRGKVAVVTGAASGIGLAMCERFAAEGARLVMADVEPDRLEAAAQALTARSGGEILTVPTDVAKWEAVETLARHAYERFGAVHVFCSNAGVVAGGPAWEIGLDDWSWVMGVNLWGAIHGIKAFTPRMIAGGEPGHIVITGSMASLLAFTDIAPYTATKFAVAGLAETLRNELAADGAPIGVSLLCPGSVATNLGRTSQRLRPGGPGQKAAPRSVGPAPVLMAPAEMVEYVVSAIRDNRFWILTHPAYLADVERRAKSIAGSDELVIPNRL